MDSMLIMEENQHENFLPKTNLKVLYQYQYYSVSYTHEIDVHRRDQWQCQNNKRLISAQ